MGSYNYNNGEVFKGEFKNNKRDGKGYVVFRDDTTKSGNWLGDKFVKKDRLKNVTRYLHATYPSYKKTKTSPQLEISSIELNIQGNEKILETNESAELVIELENNGEGNAQGIEVFLDLNNYSGGLDIEGFKIIHKNNTWRDKKNNCNNHCN